MWVLPVALAGQCLLITVYSELASEFPIAGGAYQWSRRLMGGAYGWFNGWVAICAYAVANTTIAYLGAPWALTLAGIEPTPHAIVATGMLLVLFCSLVGALGLDLLGRTIRLGIAAEALASVGIGLALLLVFREQDLVDLRRDARRRGAVGRLGARRAAGGAGGGRLGVHRLRRLRGRLRGDAATPRATCRGRSGSRCSAWAGIVILNAFAVTLAHPDPAAVVAGEDIDPVTTAVVSSFGSWSAKPFAAVVLVAFLACGMAAQALTARSIYSIARDGVLPGVGASCAGSTAARRRSGRPWPRRSWPAWACCSGSTRPRWAA